MRITQPATAPAFDSPAQYRIRVQGRLTAWWSERLEGMVVRTEQPDQGPVESTLTGELDDQGALLGVLNTLYGMHLPLLSVERLSAEQ